MLAQLNSVFSKTKYDYLSKQMLHPYKYHSISAMKIDLDVCRKKYSVPDLFAYLFNSGKQLRNDEEIINVAFEGMIQTIEQKWCVWYDSNPVLVSSLPYAPRNAYQEMLKARQEPAVISYSENDPYETFSDFTERFWRVARNTPMYEFCQAQFAVHYKNTRRPKNITKQIKKDNPMAAATLRYVFPKSSKRYRIVKRIMSCFNLE